MALLHYGDDRQLLEALRRGEERAFVALLDRYHTALLRLALSYVPDRTVAEEIVQDTWLGLLQSLDRFEGHSSLKTWLFRIFIHCAKNRRQREGRSVPFAALGERHDETGGVVAPARFRSATERWAGHWATPPRPWEALPEEGVLAHELLTYVRAALAALPPGQRAVITLRDIEGWAAGEVCTVLGISAVNQRVLLHRARAKMRQALAQYLTGE